MTDNEMNDIFEDIYAYVRDLIEWYEEDTGKKVHPIVMIYSVVRMAHDETEKARRHGNASA